MAIAHANLADYDFGLLRQFIELFPASPMAQLLQAYFLYIGLPWHEEDTEQTATQNVAEDDLDRIDIMMVGICTVECA